MFTQHINVVLSHLLVIDRHVSTVLAMLSVVLSPLLVVDRHVVYSIAMLKCNTADMHKRPVVLLHILVENRHVLRMTTLTTALNISTPTKGYTYPTWSPPPPSAEVLNPQN